MVESAISSHFERASLSLLLESGTGRGRNSPRPTQIQNSETWITELRKCSRLVAVDQPLPAVLV
jgi:hypothetical protein